MEKFTPEQYIARHIADLMYRAHNVIKLMEVPDHLFAVTNFAAANIKRVMLPENDKLWAKTGIRPDTNIDQLTTYGTQLVMIALRVGRAINRERGILGFRPIDFVAQAAILDAKEDDHAKTDQDREQGSPEATS